jgi:hypothetical protein
MLRHKKQPCIKVEIQPDVKENSFKPGNPIKNEQKYIISKQ